MTSLTSSGPGQHLENSEARPTKNSEEYSPGPFFCLTSFLIERSNRALSLNRLSFLRFSCFTPKLLFRLLGVAVDVRRKEACLQTAFSKSSVRHREKPHSVKLLWTEKGTPFRRMLPVLGNGNESTPNPPLH